MTFTWHLYALLCNDILNVYTKLSYPILHSCCLTTSMKNFMAVLWSQRVFWTGHMVAFCQPAMLLVSHPSPRNDLFKCHRGGRRHIRRIKISLTPNEILWYLGDALRGFSQRLLQRGIWWLNIRNSLKSTRSILFRPVASCWLQQLSIFPSMLPPAPPHSPASIKRQWRAPGKLWYFSLSGRLTCPLPHPSLRIPPLSCLLPPPNQCMKQWRDKNKRENTAETIFLLHNLDFFPPATSDPGNPEGWEATFAFIQINQNIYSCLFENKKNVLCFHADPLHLQFHGHEPGE